MVEIWKPIEGFEEEYEVSNLGRVRGYMHGNRYLLFKKTNPKIINPSSNGTGYQKVCLCRETKKINKYVHRLVLITFKGNHPDKMQCAHLNGDRKDNRLSNLTWLTAKENSAHKKIHGTQLLGSACPTAKLTKKSVLFIRKSKKSNNELASKYSVSAHTIRDVKKRKTWRHI